MIPTAELKRPAKALPCPHCGGSGNRGAAYASPTGLVIAEPGKVLTCADCQGSGQVEAKEIHGA